MASLVTKILLLELSESKLSPLIASLRLLNVVVLLARVVRLTVRSGAFFTFALPQPRDFVFNAELVKRLCLAAHTASLSHNIALNTR
jgi:hypothetical protein